MHIYLYIYIHRYIYIYTFMYIYVYLHRQIYKNLSTHTSIVYDKKRRAIRQGFGS